MSGPRILLVEDNPATRKMMGLALSTAGYRVGEAPDGGSALDMAREESPDLVVLDLKLPDMDGGELAREIRHLPENEALPIIAISGFVEGLESRNSFGHGFADRLLKPVDPDRLVDTVRRYLPAPEPGASPKTKIPTLLLVDDDPVQLKLGRIHLSRAGFEVKTCAVAPDAVGLAERLQPAIVVSDVLMPRMDGFQLCHALRSNPKLQDVPVVLHSSCYTEPEDKEHARRLGASDLVRRTPEFGEIVVAAEEALTTTPPAPEPGAGEIIAEDSLHLLQQLERQVQLSAGAARQSAIHAAQLLMLGSVAESLLRGDKAENAVGEVLEVCLDAAAISRSILFLRNERGEPRRVHSVGFDGHLDRDLDDLFGQRRLLEHAIEERLEVALVGEE